MKINTLFENNITPLLLDWNWGEELYSITDIPSNISDEQMDQIEQLSFSDPEQLKCYQAARMFTDTAFPDQQRYDMTWKQFVQMVKDDMQDNLMSNDFIG